MDTTSPGVEIIWNYYDNHYKFRHFEEQGHDEETGEEHGKKEEEAP